ncbi:MAG: hypothetical protein L0Z53_25580 [Acidobacteriales bacterium]|nr:hypothetical protein [Terriglobales bacterium]
MGRDEITKAQKEGLKMLSEATIGRLSELKYRSDAQWRVCLIPLTGIFWEDEMPDIRQFMALPEDDQKGNPAAFWDSSENLERRANFGERPTPLGVGAFAGARLAALQAPGAFR